MEGYIIADDSGSVLRTTFTDETDREMVAKLSEDLPALATRASSAVRDLDPTVRQAWTPFGKDPDLTPRGRPLSPRPDTPCVRAPCPRLRPAQNVMRFVRVQTKKKELMISKGAAQRGAVLAGARAAGTSSRADAYANRSSHLRRADTGFVMMVVQGTVQPE